jgi:N6-adenosine-specific RNA methylase IME4
VWEEVAPILYGCKRGMGKIHLDREAGNNYLLGLLPEDQATYRQQGGMMSDEVKVTDLEKITIAGRMLAEAVTLPEIKQVISLAEAGIRYAKAANLGTEAQNTAAEIAIRGKRKAGEVLAQLERNQGNRNISNVGKNSEYAQVLEESKTSYQDANRWEQIAQIPSEAFEEQLAETKAEGKELTTTAIIKEIQKEKRELMHEEKRTRPLPEGKYSVIYADPPWQYENSGFDEAADNQYPTMPLEEICALGISQLTDDATVIFLWATNPLLPEALQVLSSWGFEYKTNMAWIKDRGRGKGWFLKSKHELLLIGVRPNSPHPAERPDSCFEADRGNVHSRKPEMVYDIIETMYPGNKIELFARSERQGWTSWGNEI